MKHKSIVAFIAIIVLALASLNRAFAQGTTFTYQGRLTISGVPINGSYDLQLKLYDAQTAGNQIGSTITTPVTVVNGLFTTTLDFGGSAFDGNARWLEIGARTNGSASAYAILSPRPPMTTTPYAIRAGTAGAAAWSGLTGVPVSIGTNSIGSIGSNPFEITVNGARGLRLALAEGSVYTNNVNIIGGSPGNYIAPGVGGNVIAGGGYTYGGVYTNAIFANESFIGSGSMNAIRTDANFSVIGGGTENVIGNASSHSAIAGGLQNVIGINSYLSSIGGGAYNTIGTNSNRSTISGGHGNSVGDAAADSAIGGGVFNEIQTNAYDSTIGGGTLNEIRTNAYGSTISGGRQNTIETEARYSMIGGGFGGIIQSNAYHSVIGGGYNNAVRANAQFSTIGGGSNNAIQTNGYDSTISGGILNVIGISSHDATIGGGYGNTIQTNAYNTTIGGGASHTIQTNAAGSTIGGGEVNTIKAYAYDSTIGGGLQNTVETSATSATIGGGYNNTIQTGAYDTTIGGGEQNTIQSGAIRCTIGGGYQNVIHSNAATATIPGGYLNQAYGVSSFAAGYRAVAQTDGSFVWADSSFPAFDPYSQSGPQGIPNSFNVRSTGGFYIVTAINGSGTITAGAYLAAGGTSWSTLSDRNSKKNFVPVNCVEVLDTLATVPVEKWNYKHEKDTDTPNIGPMAQDFKAAFYPGRDDKTISTLEFDGVELAAIKGLHELVKEKDSEIKKLQSELKELKQELAAQSKLNAKWEARFTALEKALTKSTTAPALLTVRNAQGE